MAESEGLLRINGEIGDTSELSSIVQEGSCTLAAAAAAAAHGSYGFRCTFDGVNDNISGRAAFTPSGRLTCARWYFRFDESFTAGDTTTGSAFGLLTSALASVAYLRFAVASNAITLTRFYRFTDAGSAYTSISQAVSKGVWHYLEIRYTTASAAGANDGSAALYFDGTEIASVSGLDNDTVVPGYVTVGFPSSTMIGASGAIADFDDIKVDSSAIGAYAEAGGYAVTYDDNGSTDGSVPTDGSSPYADGATVTVLGNTGSLEKTNFVFASWNTAADGSGTTYAPGDTFEIHAATTLYAQYGLVPIARFDIVPHRRIAAVESVGVVAFSKAGIEKVTFTIAGQGHSETPIDVTEMTLNADTDVYEYCVEIDHADFTSYGAFTIGAVATGLDGGTRDLGTLTLYVAETAYTHYADVRTTGNDDTGAVDDDEHPFLTVGAALAALTAVQGNVSGCEVRLGAGSWSLGSATIAANTEWLVYTKTADATVDNVIIYLASSARSAAYVAFRNVTLKQTNSSNGAWLASNPANLWLDGAPVIGAGRYVYPGSTPVLRSHSYPTYWTNCEVSDCDYGVSHSDLARNVVIRTIGNDPVVNTYCCINIDIDDVDPGTTYWHADGYQSHTYKPENRVLYGYRATDLHYQGIFVRHAVDDGLDGFALVNAAFEMREPGRPGSEGGAEVLSCGSFYGILNHLLMWGCTFIGDSKFSFYDETSNPLAVTNSSFRGCTFPRIVIDGGGSVIGETPAWCLNGNTGGNEWLDNNYEANEQADPYWYSYAPDTSAGGDRHSIGSTGIDTTPSSTYFLMPTSTSALRNAWDSPGIAIDIAGITRGVSADIGAYEFVSAIISGSYFLEEDVMAFEAVKGQNQIVTPAAASASISINKDSRAVMLYNAGSAICHVRIGNTATGSPATTADTPVPPGVAIIVRKSGDENVLSHISADGTTLHVQTGDLY